MSQPKVFEFAKEVGLAPLALMDKIRDWGLPVKSHMAELTTDQVELITKKLGLSGANEAKEEKPKAKRKTASVKKKATDVAPVIVKSSKSNKSVTDEESKALKSEEPAVSPRVVRRKKANEVEAIEVPQPVQDTVSPVKEEKSQEIPELPLVHKVKAESSSVGPLKEETKTEPLMVAPAIENLKEIQDPETPTEAIFVKSESPVIEKATVTSTTATPLPRKKEVTIGASGVASQPSAAATQVRRNIVGRMDLSRVQGMGGAQGASNRPSGGGYQGNNPRGPVGVGSQSTSHGPGGMRPKTNIRAGFVSMPQFNIPMPEESSEDFKAREEKRREKEKLRDGAAAAREQGDAPPEFDASEFKKRELVFQPKKKTNSLNRPALKTQITQSAAHKRVLKVDGVMKLQDVATSIGVKTAELTKVLIKNGVMATPQTSLDFETLSLIVPDFGWEVQNVLKSPEELIEEFAFGNLTAEPVLRAPVVTIMGHVDHGKTSLLDAIREAKVAQGEAGGITQHIGAYQVVLDDNYKITFLDTPGHEAFTAMRARGANVTDIAIVVVAADDGMMPQTAEAISHAKAAGVPIIVAVNKMDKQGANPDKVMQQLTELQIVPEEWGGDAIYVKVSALQKTGIAELLNQIRLLAEMAEIKANPQRSATGIVIEAKLDKGRGPVATLLIKDGTVTVGQWIVAGSQKGRVRSLVNDKGEKIDKVLPGAPAELLGLDGVPSPGDRFDVVKDEEVANRVVGLRKTILEQEKLISKKATLEEIFAKVKSGDVKELNIVLKADVHGSLEALQGMMSKLGNDEVKLKIIHSAVGGITESDVLLASTAKGLVIGFNVRPDSKSAQLAKNNGIDVRSYSVVYELMDDLRKALSGMLAPTIVENVLGRAEVRNTFTVPKIGTIAGCFVQDGKVQRGALTRLIRNGKIVYEGKMGSLKRFKDDAKEVAAGYECGIGIENFNDVKNGDVIEVYIKEEVTRQLESPTNPSAQV